jgi:TolA-binding protein
MSMDSKKLAIVIAGGMPPPNQLKKGGSMKMDDTGGDSSDGADEGESPQDEQDESDSGEKGGGKAALRAAFDAMKSGDMDTAWDEFCDAIDIAKNRSTGGNEKGGPY